MPSPLLLLANAPALDPSPPSRRRARPLAAPLATSLIAAVMGITACDSPDDPPLSLRQGDIQPVDIEPASLACMLQTQVFLHHADNTIEATPDVQHAFSDLLRAGDRVDFTFIPDPACDNQGKRLTLAAYALDSAYDDSPPPHPELFALDVSALAPDGGTLSVQMPPCATLLLHEGGHG